jgi:hypothetical protein
MDPLALGPEKEVHANHQHNQRLSGGPISDVGDAQVKGIKETTWN